VYKRQVWDKLKDKLLAAAMAALAAFVAALIDKQRRNERRSWPSGSNPDDATHHLEDSDP